MVSPQPAWTACARGEHYVDIGPKGLQRAAGELARDDQPLDLGRAFPDLVDLRVAVPLLYRKIADIAVPTEDLDGFVGHLHRDIASFEFGHAGLSGEGPIL